MSGEVVFKADLVNVEKYLERIGYAKGLEPTAGNLAALAKAHRYAVPYESLDLWRRRRTTLATEELYDKIVTRHRGGYCFELNGLFAWLLRQLGYNVREYFGRWLMGEDMAVPKRRHRVVCVALPHGPNKIVDVGIGMAFVLAPLDFVFDVPQPQGTQIYRIVKDPVLTCVVQIRKKDGAWVNLFSFDTAPQLPVDFAYAHWWCATHPESQFLQKMWVFLPLLDGGSKAISLEPDPETGELATTLGLFGGDGKVEKTVLRGEAAFAAALKEHFGIVETPGRFLDDGPLNERILFSSRSGQ